MFLRNVLSCVDHHHGQASRTILSGYPAIRGRTMREKSAFYIANMPWVHESLLREPRGHRNMLGAILTDPVSEEAEFGILFLHPSGMFDGCGDSTFAAAAALIEMGMVEAKEPLTRFALDTVLGLLEIEADVSNGIVNEVRFRNVPSYHVGDMEVALQDGRTIQVEVAFGGLYYGFVDAKAAQIELSQDAQSQIISTAQALWQAIGSQTTLADPATGKVVPIDLFTFVARQEVSQGSKYLAANVYKPGRLGRTPSGTGSSAHLALRVAKGTHAPDQPFVQQSLMGTYFTGSATLSTLPGGHACVLPTVGTKSYMMGLSQFVIDPADPYARGFILES